MRNSDIPSHSRIESSFWTGSPRFLCRPTVFFLTCWSCPTAPASWGKKTSDGRGMSGLLNWEKLFSLLKWSERLFQSEAAANLNDFFYGSIFYSEWKRKSSEVDGILYTKRRRRRHVFCQKRAIDRLAGYQTTRTETSRTVWKDYSDHQ